MMTSIDLAALVLILVLAVCGFIGFHFFRRRLNIQEAAGSGSVKQLKYLLGKGQDINARDEYGSTALNEAIEYAQFEAAMFLLEQGADPTIEDDCGRNAWIVATTLHPERRASEPEAYAKLIAVLEEGWDLGEKKTE